MAGVLIASLYAPNGNPQPGPKFAYKLAWHERLRRHAADLLAAGVPVVLAGDYNVAPGAARRLSDAAPTTTTRWCSRRAARPMRALLAQGWTDALRAMHPEGAVFTFWDYRRNRWERDGGMRLDHLLLSPDLAPRLTAAGVDAGGARRAGTPATTRR